MIWAVVLCWLSHGDLPNGVEMPEIPFFDKVLHFGYFFGGGGLLSAYLFFQKKKRPWSRLLFIAVVSLAVVGVLDEWHQSFF